MKITSETRFDVRIEDDDGNIAVFSGEHGVHVFFAYADSIRWVRCKGEATEKAKLDFILKVIEYLKEDEFTIIFYDNNNKILFENILGLKTKVYRSKFFFIVLSGTLAWNIYDLTIRVMSAYGTPMFKALSTAYAIIFPIVIISFIIYGIYVWRFRVVAEGDFIRVRPSMGREYKFPADDITKVVRIITNGVKKITIYTKTNRISLKQSMSGIGEMNNYLLRHVDSSKIITKYKKVKNIKRTFYDMS